MIRDHKPRSAFFGSKKEVLALATATLQRWVILLSAYMYDHNSLFKANKMHLNANVLSRLLLTVHACPKFLSPESVCILNKVSPNTTTHSQQHVNKALLM